MGIGLQRSLHGDGPASADRSSVAGRGDAALKKGLLARIVEQAAWLDGAASQACRQGCSHCCTQSVTMTTLEGEGILEYLLKEDPDIRHKIRGLLARRQDTHSPEMTTNQFARFCLEGRDILAAAERPGIWNLDRCLFLASGSCTIYPARPFACRAMVSQKICEPGGAAAMAPVVITLNSIWLQLIEHIDVGGFWGNMFDILDLLTGEQDLEDAELPEKPTRLLRNQALPGFLIPPAEQAEVSTAIAGLFQTTINGQPFSRQLKRIGKERG